MKIRCICCGKEVDEKDAVYVERKTDHYYAGVEGFVCRDCWCNGNFNVGCSGACHECPLQYYCWKWCLEGERR